MYHLYKEPDIISECKKRLKRFYGTVLNFDDNGKLCPQLAIMKYLSIKMRSNNNIKAIIFDVGRVLVNVDLDTVTNKLFSDIDGDTPDEVFKAIITNPLMKKYMKGLISPEQFYQGLSNLYALNISYETFTEIWTSLFSPMPGMADLLKQIDRSLQLGLLSDTDPLHWTYLTKSFPHISQFKNMTLSFKVGIVKPNPKIYLLAAASVKTPPESCLFIDDMQRNIDGANSVGMHGIKFENVTQLTEALSEFSLLNISSTTTNKTSGTGYND